MPKKNATVKAVWIDNDILGKFEEKLGGQSINSWLKEQIKAFVEGENSTKNEKKGVNPKNSKNFSANAYDLGEIEEMVTLSGLTMEKFISDLTELMLNGGFDMSGGKLRVVNPSWTEKFEEACHDLCIPVEKAAESAIKGLKK